MFVKPFVYLSSSIDFFHFGHVAGELLDEQRLGDRTVLENLAVAELHHPDLHVLQPVILAHGLVNVCGNKLFQDLESRLCERAASVDRNDEVLLGDAELVAPAPVLVASADVVPGFGFQLGALTLAANGDEHSAPPLLEASAASHGARRPPGPLLQLAVAVARARVARPRLLDGITLLAAVLWFSDDAAGAALDASLAVFGTLAES